MLEALREMTGGIVAKILIGLLVLSFAVWGVSDVFLGGTGDTVVEVGETKVSLVDYRFSYEQQSNQVQRQLNQRLTREQLRGFGVEQNVLSQIVTGAVLDENARLMGLGLSDDRLAELIAQDPSFQDSSGNFSRLALESVLRQIGMRQQDYIRNRQSFAVRNQLISAMAGNLSLPDTFYDALSAFQGQKRVFDYVVVGPQALNEPVEPTPSDLEAFFEANKGDYRAPEYRELTIVTVSAESIADPDALDIEEVRAEYDRTKDRLAAPERRQVQQLSFNDAEEARQIADRLAGGANFEDMLGELERSLDDVNLGLLTRSELPDEAIANAAFSLPLNTASGVVQGVFGPVILRVTEIQADRTPPFEEVEAELRQRLAVDTAADELYDIHDRLEDERAAGDPLPEAAKKAGIDAMIIAAIDARGNTPDGTAVEGIPESGRVLTAAFDIGEGVEADPILLGTEGFVWYEVTGITDERQRTYDEVRDQVREAWIVAETASRVDAIAQQIRERTEKGEELARVAQDLLGEQAASSPSAGSGSGLTTDTDSTAGGSALPDAGSIVLAPASLVQTSAQLARSDTGPGLVGEAVRAGFEIAKGTLIVAPGETPQQRVVLQVRDVVDDAAETPDTVANQLNERLADDMLTNFVTGLQSRQEIIINRHAIETAITF